MYLHNFRKGNTEPRGNYRDAVPSKVHVHHLAGLMVYNTVATLVYKLFIFFCEHKLLKNVTIIIKEYYVVRYVKVTVHHPLPADLFADRYCILLFKVMKSWDKLGDLQRILGTTRKKNDHF